MIAWKETILAKAWQSFAADGPTQLLTASARRATGWLTTACSWPCARNSGRRPGRNGLPNTAVPTGRPSLVASAEMVERIDFFRFEQYLFHNQWQRLREHARAKNIRIIGDLPIYVGADSVDVWANQRIFELHATTRQPVRIAGVPPDYFSKTGQRWGNPLYRWGTRKGAVKKQLFDWWHERLAAIFSLVDVIRIDHFRGFESYWSIPGAEATAENGAWKKGPGLPFFQEMHHRLGPLADHRRGPRLHHPGGRSVAGPVWAIRA